MNASRHHLIAIALGAIVLSMVSGAVGYWIARPRSASANAVSVTTGAQQEPLYWYDPMVPTQHFDKPGKSPFMDMQLIPKYAQRTADEDSGIRIDPSMVQNLGIRTTEVKKARLSDPLTAIGTLSFNQRDVAVLQARAGGFVTRVYARAPGDVIGRDAAIVDLLIPEWAGAQTEFLAILKSGERDLFDAARQRLLLLGMPVELIDSVESSGVPKTTVTIRSPLAGVIETLDIRAGMAISAGSTLAKVNGLATVWLEAAVPETQGALAQLGKDVEAHLQAYPGEMFKGRVIAVLPQANVETRTVRVRIELANPEQRLRPGMFANVQLARRDQNPVLYVDSESIIRTGTRTVVIVAADEGRFIPTEVQVGTDIGGKTVILKGLRQGQRVVSSGQFLIDSEANLRGVLERLASRSSGDNTRNRTTGSEP